MSGHIKSIIVGTGNFIPENVVSNNDFLQNSFYEKTGERILRENADVITKFQAITEIEERRYANADHNASDLGYFAAKNALDSSKIDPESLDYIIVAHNFGDIGFGSTRATVLPTLASRIKHKLGIQNPDCVAYDLPFGCPGWLQGMIQADYYIRSGDAKRVMIIGTETLSRVTDPHDRDSMIYSDGAGATILEGQTGTDKGILAHKTQTHTATEAFYLYSGKSSNPDFISEDLFIKMDGRRIYEHALTHVPLVIKQTLDKAGIDVWELIGLANKHPRVNILQPGSGVGGHCIAVDPYFIVSDYPLESKIIGTAREVNNFKSFWCTDKIQQVKQEYQIRNDKKPSLAFMGISFKPDVGDLRESPAEYIVQKVLQNDNNENYYISEPNIKDHNIFKLTHYKEACNLADIIIFLVNHKEFKELSIPPTKVVLDFCGVFSTK